MLVALDYDNTWTRRPAFWRAVVELGAQHDVAFVVVTNRHSSEPVGDVAGLDVIYCMGQPKKRIARERGMHVDVWVDDLPYLVHLGNVPEPSV